MPTKAAKLKALRHARRRIESGQDRFICWALPSTPAGDHLRRFVMKELKGTQVYSRWVVEKSPFTDAQRRQTRRLFDETGHARATHIARLSRLRWIDAMIKAVETDQPVQGDW